MDAEAVGRLIARRRRERNWSQGDLARRLHVTDKAVSRWETGRGMPSVDLLGPLAEALDLSVSELLSGRELTAEELPKAADEQIVERMRQERVRLLQGVLAALILIAALAGIFAGYHFFTSTPETDTERLTALAAEYLGKPRRLPVEFQYERLRIVETERRGDYLAALCTDGAGRWAMCVYDRDELFPDRWRGGGGKPSLAAGALGSWNFGNPREAVIIFCGGDLPKEAAYYTFQNSGVSYTCPIRDGQVLDVFLLPDTGDIGSYPETLLDADMRPLDGHMEGAAKPAA